MGYYKLLGTVVIEENGAPSKVMKSPKGQALLAYLIVTGELQPREKLADLIWDATTTKRALQNLRQLLSSTLRHEVAELKVNRNALIFQPTDETFVDLYKLKEALISRELEQLEAGLQLYQGDLLADLYLPDAPRFNEWVAVVQEQLRQQVQDGYRYLCENYVQQKQWERLVSVTHRWLSSDELLEEAHFWLTLALKETGRWQTALSHYQSYVQIMANEFGLPPSPQMVDLYEAIHISRAGMVGAGGGVQPSARKSRSYWWGEAPREGQFYGREHEIEQLTEWLTKKDAQLIAILGIGGQGKTTLAATAVRALADQFDGVFWRSVINAPPLQGVLTEFLNYLSHNQQASPNSIAEQLAEIRSFLQNGRYLLILDNLETILDAEQTGHFRAGYEGYKQLLQLFGQGGHQSCLLLTSRETPADLTRLIQQADGVYQLSLPGLSLSDSNRMLQAAELSLTAESSTLVVERYSGNPLALKLAVQAIQEIYFGDVAAFLEEETAIFDDIYAVLEQQFERLSPFEQEILFWLAVTREAMTPPQLAELIVKRPHQRSLLETMKRLRRRSLLERQAQGFTLQNVITEYLTQSFIDQIENEIVSGQLTYLKSHALLLAQTQEHIRQSQVRLIIRPIAERISSRFSLQEIDLLFRQLLEQLRQEPLTSGYAAGNLLNLLLHLKIDVTGYDFSHLNVWQAELKGRRLPAVNFTDSDLSNATFTDVFDSIYTVAFSPNGGQVAVGSSNGMIRLLDASTGQPVAILNEHNDAVWSVVFSPDGQLLASGGIEGVIYLWDVSRERVVRKLIGHEVGVHGLAFSPDGQTLASGSTDNTIRLWDVASGQTKDMLTGHEGNVQAVAFSPDGRILASGGRDNTVRVWSLTAVQSPVVDESGTMAVCILETHTNWIYTLAFSPDGRTLASGGEDGRICLWDTAPMVQQQAEPKPHQILQGHTAGVQTLGFSPDGKLLVSGSNDYTVRLWQTATGKPLQILQEHSNWVRAVAFSPDGQVLATAAFDESVCLWKANRSGWYPHRKVEGYSNWIFGLAFSPDNKRLASGHTDSLVNIWNIETGQLEHTLQGHTNWVFHVTFSPDGKQLASSSFDHTVQLWETETWQPQQRLQGHQDSVTGVAFSPRNNLLASGSLDGFVYLWDLNSGEVIQRFKSHNHWINSVAFSPDGNYVLSGSSDGTAVLRNLTTGAIEQLFEGHDKLVQQVAFHPNGKTLATSSLDRTIRLWDVSTGATKRILVGHTNGTQGVAFSPNGKTLASSSYDQTVRLWEVETGRLLRIFAGHDSRVLFTTFSLDGSLLASSAIKSIKLWNPDTGECLQSWQAPGPYDGMIISSARGLTEVQKAVLTVLGATTKVTPIVKTTNWGK